MTNGTGNPPAGAPAQITWRQLRRVNSHRTSRPTDEALRKVVGEIASVRGNAPSVDAVILGAVRLALVGGADGRARLMDAVREIESDTYPGPHSPGEPGDPGTPGE